ncbi:MAG: DUF1294 domain-containing protein [Lachnospiraceae bacterium]|nr:DUF1294 domain-containing protein [Lachnospiraceae bacterium]
MTIIKEAAIIYFLVINIAAFAAFGIDKFRAKRGAWRVSESTLIAFAAVGGSIGALLGMYVFHHKTRHLKFTVGVPVILAVYVIISVLLTVLI